MKNKKLTKNFSLFEFKCRDGSHVPKKYMANVQELAENLQVLRDELKKPITIISGYRSPSHNKKVRGAPKSLHTTSQAVDIKVKGVSPKRLYRIILRLIKEKRMCKGGVGLYRSWIHYDCRGFNRRWKADKRKKPRDN